MQLGANEDEAKVFTARAVPQRLCENLTNAPRLLANQQRDGDSPNEHIVTGSRENSRERVTNGLRSFFASDNYSAVGGGDHLLRGQMNGDRPEVPRKGADDLTPRVEEVDTQKACINVEHIDETFLRPPVVDADWHAFCQAIYEGIEGNEWEELYFHYRDMSKAAGAKKPIESQKSKSPLGDEGSQRQGGGLI